MSENQLAQELLLKEDQLIRISTRVVYGCAAAITAAAIWLTTISLSQAQTRKDLDDHLKAGAEYRALNDKRWLRINNALIRLQANAGVKVPPSELDDDLTNE